MNWICVSPKFRRCPLRCARKAAGALRLAWLLTRELVRLATRSDIGTGDLMPGQLVVTQPGPYGACGAIDDWQVCEWMNIASAVERSGESSTCCTATLIFWGVPLSRLSRAPMVHTTHYCP